MTPNLQQNAGIFLLDWPEDKVSIRIDRLRSHSDVVSGEMTVKAQLPGINGHLHQARENLVSTTARRTLAKHLDERCPDVDWRAILEEACVLTLAAYRQGEPVVELHSAKRREGPRWRVQPFLMDRLPNMIYGDGGVGKSAFSLFLTSLVSCGRQTCGLWVMPGSVLYLDFEADEEEMRERLELIEAGFGEPGCAPVLYRYCCQPLTDDIEEIQGVVAENKIDLVVVDSMGVALGNVQGDPRIATIEYFRALRSLRCTTLTIHHITKDKERTNHDPYGSVYIRNSVRNMWEMRKQQEPGEEALKVGLYHRKVNYGPLLRPLGYRLSFQDSGLYVSQTDVRDVPELAEGMSAKGRIQAALRQGYMTAEALAEEIGIPLNQVKPRLSELRKAGGVINEKGMWGLATDQEE